MKNKPTIICLIILLSIIAILIIILLCKLLTNKIKLPIFGYNISDELIIDEKYEMDFEKIDIKSDASDIHIKETTDSKIKLLIYGDKDIVEVKTENNELTINTKDKRNILFNNKISKIEIYLPQNYEKEIYITNKYGDIEIGNLINTNIEITEDCGDVNIIGSNNLKINNSYGDIRIQEAKDAHIKASAGDIKIEKVNNIIVENNYGDIDINNIENSISAVDKCGNIKINTLNITQDSNIYNKLGDIRINNINEIYINAHTKLGETKINNNYQKSDITLKIENDCGDIKVE